MLSARTFLFPALLYCVCLTPIIATVTVKLLNCAGFADPPIRDTIDCLHVLDIMSLTPNPLEPAFFRDGDCVALLYRVYSQTPWAHGGSAVSPRMPPGRGPRPENAPFHPELFPTVVKVASDLVQKCFDEPYSGNRARGAGARGCPNSGGTTILVGGTLADPCPHNYGIEVFSAPRDMPKGIKQYRMGGPDPLTFHIYEAPTWAPSARSSSQPGSPSRADTAALHARPSGSSRRGAMPNDRSSAKRKWDDGASKSGRS